jgi:hypothetical protein
MKHIKQSNEYNINILNKIIKEGICYLITDCSKCPLDYIEPCYGIFDLYNKENLIINAKAELKKYDK